MKTDDTLPDSLPPPASTTEPAAKKDDAPELPQANAANLGILNPAWMADNPLYTLTTEFWGALPFLSETKSGEKWSFRPPFTVNVRDRLGPNVEFGLIGGFGGTVPYKKDPATGSGLLGATLHVGPEQPKGDNVGFGTGAWFQLYQGWGAEPDRPIPPQGWSFNPNFNFMIAHSWMKPDSWDVDLAWGATIARWGAVNDVNVGGWLSPFLGLNVSKNLSKHDVLNWEGTVGANLGLAGRQDGVPNTNLPASLLLNFGLFGYQHTWDDWAFGLEPWIFAEPTSNVANPDERFWNVGGGLRVDLTAINPRRTHVEDF
ncbi:MAG: hypothetical protein JO164_10775 [Candidatus Eremiobacteraeota bacterium]|nr:hypothetical protein [Candidatus Eremiobacteraeota bacterium]